MKSTKTRMGAVVVIVALLIPAVALAAVVTSPFVDVVPGKFYETPINWAFNNSITTGKDATHFEPDGAVTRGESVTFLKRYDDHIVQPAISALGQTVGGLNCTSGQIAKFDGTNWACGTDTDTTIPNTDTLAALGCAAGQVARWDGTAWVCNSVGLTTVVAAGSITTVDNPGDFDLRTSIAIGVDNMPMIAYFDTVNVFLKAFHCGNAACTTGTVSSLDTGGTAGSYGSIAIGADGFPIISYYEIVDSDLEVFHCEDRTCTTGTPFLVDTLGFVGSHTSIAIGADDLPIISYYDLGNQDLKVFHCTNTVCDETVTTGTATTVDSIGIVGEWNSIAIGADGFPVISYYDSTNQHLKVFHCTDTACTAGTATTVDAATGVGQYTSLAIGTDGFPIISYRDSVNQDLKAFHCTVADCTAGTASTLDPGTSGDAGNWTSIAIGPDGFPFVTHRDSVNQDLKFFHCTDTACTGGTTTVLDGATGNVGFYTSTAIGADNKPIISYFDSLGAVRVAQVNVTVTGLAFG